MFANLLNDGDALGWLPRLPAKIFIQSRWGSRAVSQEFSSLGCNRKRTTREKKGGRKKKLRK